MPERYFRIEDVLVSAGLDEFDHPLGPPRVQLYVRRYPLLKVTPKGAWIDDYGRKRFVLASATKKYACPTLDGAIESFLARKQRQKAILHRQLSNVETAIYQINNPNFGIYLSGDKS